ncbi:hypothetical protein C0J52_25781 [Blattella germanica]|nr:hypothetical protein C0J52_25781 [Blattella germanica]
MQIKKCLLILLYFWNGCNSVLKPVTESRIEKYVADCILSISTTYFNKEFPVLIQTPIVRRNKDFQIGEKLFQMLQSEQIYSHIVFSISRSSKKFKNTKPGSYVIILPPLLTYNDMHKTLLMHKKIKQNAYQPKGKLLVVATQKTIIPAANVYFEFSRRYGFSKVVVIEPDFAHRNINIFTWEYFGLLVDPEVLPPIKSIRELEKSGLILERGIHVGSGNELWNYLKNYEFVIFAAPVYSKIARDRKNAFLTCLWNANRISNSYRDSRGKSQIITIDEKVATLFFFMEFKNLPCVLLEVIDSTMHRFYETGIIAKWLEDDIRIVNYPSFLKPEVVKVFTFSLLEFQGAFYLILLGVVISLLVFVIELLFIPLSISFIKWR